MKIDFHTHGKITSTFPFDEESFKQKIEEAKNTGIDSLALTEHAHAKYFLEAYQFLEKNYEYKQDYYLVEGIKVFTGIEITTYEDLDILCIGRREEVIKLYYKILEAPKQEFLKIDGLFLLLDNKKLLIIMAHPYRNHKEFPQISKEIFNKLDSIEWNAKDLYKQGIEEMKEKVSRLAEQVALPITGGSDSHYFLQIGSIKNKFNADCETISELKQQIKQRNFVVEISQELSLRVRSSTIIKKLIKGDK